MLKYVQLASLDYGTSDMAKFVHSGHKMVGIALKEYKDLPLQVKAGTTKAIYYFS